ncbi:hypothetical protein V2J09_017267, partial [Rumex salicifolius]
IGSTGRIILSISSSFSSEGVKEVADNPFFSLNTKMLRQIMISRNSTRILREASSSHWLHLSYSSYSDSPNMKTKATPLQERRMIDRFRFHVKGGDGGSGCSSVRRSRTDRFGKPDGANGGRGGDVILQCTSAVWDFRGLQHHVNGFRGGHGTSKNKIGSRGEDKIVRVPVGTVIHLVEGEIPSDDVDQQVSEFSDPWEVPGTLSSDVCESDQDHKCLSTSSRKVDEREPIRVESSSLNRRHGIRRRNERKFSINRSCQTSSTQSYYGRQTSVPEEVLLPDDDDDEKEEEDENDNDYDDSTEMDHDMSEGDWEEEEEIQYNVAELTEEGQQIVVARGGEGGLGSISFGRSSRKTGSMMKNDLSKKNYSDEFDEEDHSPTSAGLPGSEALMILELKTIADVGFVGMPNAGKSTLLGAMSRAKPAVGDYAFTTLRPNIGKLNYDDLSMSVADIPGLIKGAHLNRGLGLSFLRHIERTKVLAYVVDLAAALDGRKGIPPWEQLRDLVMELEHYSQGLSTRPSLVVANKIDEAGAEDVCKELQRRVKGVPIFPVCAILEEGVPELKTGLRLLVDGTDTSTLSLDSILVD